MFILIYTCLLVKEILNAVFVFVGITLHDEALDWAAAGDHVSLTVTGIDIMKIK